MTAISSSNQAAASQGIWSRFFSRVDANADGGLDIGELAAVSSQGNASGIMSALDKDKNGKLQPGELPHEAFSPQMLGSLLSAQEYGKATPEEQAADDKNAISALFARADVNGDGVLSKDELDADRALNMASFLDTGKFANAAFAINKNADPNALTPGDFRVGRVGKLETVSGSKLPDDWMDQFAKIRDAAEQANPDLKTRKLPDARAEMEGKLRDTHMSAAFMTRLIMSLSTQVPPVSDTASAGSASSGTTSADTTAAPSATATSA